MVRTASTTHATKPSTRTWTPRTEGPGVLIFGSGRNMVVKSHVAHLFKIFKQVLVWMTCLARFIREERTCQTPSASRTLLLESLGSKWCIMVYPWLNWRLVCLAMPSCRLAYAQVMPYWEETIAPMLKQGKTVFVAAHGNSIRAIVKMRLGSGIVVKWLRFKPAGVYSIWLKDSWCNGALT